MGSPFVLVRKSVDVLIRSKRRDRVVVPVSVGRKGVVRRSV